MAMELRHLRYFVAVVEEGSLTTARRQTALFDHRYEITQVPQLHRHPMPERYAPELTKSFSRAPWKPTVSAIEAG